MDMATPTLLSRRRFRENCLTRDRSRCVIPWCTESADEVHHIIERSIWPNGGYYERNGASVCNRHHQVAERNDIPPQAFWQWIGVEPLVPEEYDTFDINKWGDEFETPPWQDEREYIKYPSTGHLPFSYEWDNTRVDFQEVDELLEIPLVVTIKMDGGNAMLVKDADDPVRARNGKYAEHQSFDLMKRLYWQNNLYEKIPENIQIFGEWLYAKHSIHYGCDCEEQCDDVGPDLDSYFQVFGVYDNEYNIWLSWDDTQGWAEEIGFPTVPVLNERIYFSNANELYTELVPLAEEIVEFGNEGIVIRPRYPMHYGQFERKVGKYVRENHVDPDSDHWKLEKVKPNVLSDRNSLS